MDVVTFLKSRWRVTLGMLLVTLLAVYNLLGTISWNTVLHPRRPGNDEVSVYCARFAELRHTLQFQRVAGYRDDGAKSSGWFLAQYTLAPTILVQGVEPPLVVANFHSDSSPEKHWVEENLVLIRNYGDRVSLYEGKER